MNACVINTHQYIGRHTLGADVDAQGVVDRRDAHARIAQFCGVTGTVETPESLDVLAETLAAAGYTTDAARISSCASAWRTDQRGLQDAQTENSRLQLLADRLRGCATSAIARLRTLCEVA